MALSDEAVIAGMASGDTDAMAVFVRRYQARVYGLALSVVDDAGLAEEVAQDAFMRVWRHAAAYDPRRGRVPTWLLTITRNLAVDAVRLRRDQPVDPEQLVAALADEAAEPEPDGAERLWAGLRTLPAGQARPIVMAIVYGLTAKEIAAREGIPLGTAKTRIRRGLARLRAALAAGDGEAPVSAEPRVPAGTPRPAGTR
ncbi:MAG TPA: sigma-70 family RNA polymerase sigma factor [Micromonosporaceae bacterium]|nr:sigma-70 family RNA polymerase sigma factor [Micromonosporaceae bacterium]